MKNLLLISNSTNPGEEYLGWPRDYIRHFLGDKRCKVLFVPYAGVNLSNKGLKASFDVYEQRVAAVYKLMGYELKSIHRLRNPLAAVASAEAIAVGGGNTWHLVKMMQETGVMHAIAERTLQGTPFMGWSAGANVACPTLRTTNDMPIIEPPTFNAMSLVPFQINPHYLDANPEGHGGETRQQRIEEFLAINPKVSVVGLREASLLEVHGEKMELKGRRSMRLFKAGQEPVEFESGSDLSFLLK
jgi:dipeptidase E